MKYCGNCGTSINEGELFCRMCGNKVAITSIDSSDSIQQSGQNVDVNIPTQNNISLDEELMTSYIGRSINDFKSNFSIFFFLFGIFYSLYRKMWLLSITIIAANLVINQFLSSISYIISLAMNIFISINFNKWYLKHVEEQVEKIKLNNRGKSKEELMMICKSKGGTSLLIVCLFAIPSILYYILLLIIFFAIA